MTLLWLVVLKASYTARSRAPSKTPYLVIFVFCIIPPQNMCYGSFDVATQF